MICPLYVAGMLADPQVGVGGDRMDDDLPLIQCHENACAWWCAESGKCAVLVIGESHQAAVNEMARKIDDYEERH